MQLIVFATLAAVAHATLPADNGGVTTFGAGDVFAGGFVNCSNSSGTYSFTIAPESAGAALIVFALQPSDRFTAHMAGDNASLDAFLGSDAVGAAAVGNTSYLFLAYGASDAAAAGTTAAFRARLAARAAIKSTPAEKLLRMHFATEEASGVKGLGAVLKQWTTPITSISYRCDPNHRGSVVNVSRLDGKYGACPWPGENAALAPLVDAGDGCVKIDPEKYKGMTVVATASNCSQSAAVKNG